MRHAKLTIRRVDMIRMKCRFFRAVWGNMFLLTFYKNAYKEIIPISDIPMPYSYRLHNYIID
jgi:hypothetical protein